MNEKIDETHQNHWMKSVRIWSFYGPHLYAFTLNMERYSVLPHSQSKCGKIWTKRTPNKDTFYAMNIFRLFIMKSDNVGLYCYVNTVLT